MPVQLTESDLGILRELVSWWRSQVRRSVSDPRMADHEEHPAPEVYVARTPAGGVPGLTEEAGTGLDDFNDVPGSAVCDVFRLSDNVDVSTGTGTDTYEATALIAVNGLKRTVWNLSKVAVVGDSWVLVIRDKTGRWWVSNSDGTAGDGAECLKVLVDVSVTCVNGVLTVTKTFKYIRGTFTVSDTACVEPGTGTGTP